VASLYAMGFNYKEILILFKKYSKKIKYIDTKNIFKLIYGILIKRKIVINGLNSGEIIEEIFNKVLNKKNIKKIKDIKMPLLIPSVDIHNGKIHCFCSKNIRSSFSDEIVFESNIDIAKAVRASCSYPAVFSPCKYKNAELIDGGIRENVPWKGLKEIGAERVISVVFEKENDGKCCKNIIDVISNSLEILSHELLNYEIIGSNYLLKIKTKNISLLDMEKIDELFNIGYETAKLKIKEIKKIINKNY
jgi:NTE family protein